MKSQIEKKNEYRSDKLLERRKSLTKNLQKSFYKTHRPANNFIQLVKSMTP